ncbi:AAA family ATPase [Hymenobacter volaticus]|uniref:AAA family ATPase n=1 Tax=Hymenobacter volaticus TaxID=2932254 RepID=A0ABY4GDP5_9BACT|nr:AAA family ATPase [Hymenobacter volaticus]UOQ68887.1 AAA family ATPase [Hymenobacter volaticus]
MAQFLISGGPGAGKSTLLTALQEQGYTGVEEASRVLIQEQVAAGSGLVPWQNLAGFAELALTRMVDQYEQARQRGGATFFDRGIPDIIAYLEVGGIPVPKIYHNAAAQYRYHPAVLMAPPWPAIYVNDAERWQTFAEAAQLYQALYQTYQRLGYQLVELPLVPVMDRVQFVQSWVATHQRQVQKSRDLRAE